MIEEEELVEAEEAESALENVGGRNAEVRMGSGEESGGRVKERAKEL
jgi:hypothetical protein